VIQAWQGFVIVVGIPSAVAASSPSSRPSVVLLLLLLLVGHLLELLDVRVQESCGMKLWEELVCD
jgi:hypothetical protein